MKTLTALAVAAAAFAATPALAQDESNFAGPYFGGYVGYDHVTINEDTTGTSGSKDGVAFGAIAGYNIDMGNVVLGIEGEIGDASTRASETDVFVLGDQATLSANLDLFIGARAGVKVSDKALVYVKGGYANTKVNLAYDDNDGFAYDESDDLSGFRIGGGVEIAATDRISFRAEYRYSQYSEYKYQGVATGLDANRHQVVFGAVGRF
ncbi:outer membrane protein [Novosphingobium aquiterrae]|uniref:Outer membrane protein n=1 Tax=Novosphingobium aquiterrae TaxID=624388 RepID=A0ABV6PEN3_9SPHN